MYNKCCVVNCVSRRKDVSFHMFPKTEIGLQKWLQCINCEKLRSLPFRELRKHFVCQKHFEKRFLSSTCIRARLLPGAYPTLISASEIFSGNPETLILNTGDNREINHEHNYYRKIQHIEHSYCLPEVVKKPPKIDTEMTIIPFACSQNKSEAVNTEKPVTETDLVLPACPENIDMPSTSRFISEAVTNEKLITDATMHHTPCKKRRHRIVHRKNKLTPQCTRLYREFTKSRRQLNFNIRAKKALKFSKYQSFEKLTERMNPLTKKFLWMQINQYTKKARGRRYTDEEKLIAMAIMKQSPKCYKFLHKIFILPSKYIINKMVSRLGVEAGINTQIFEAVKKEVSKWDTNKKYCSILFDEVALETALTYDKYKDVIGGFVELTAKTTDFADHALVFMLRGVVKKWQQPLAFYFCKGATTGIILKKIIKDVVIAVGGTGLIPLTLVCDQGTAFQSALKSLQEETRRKQIIAGEKTDDLIVISNYSLSVIHDPPHLIKGLRNNFLTKNIKFDNKISKWSDIVEVYKADCNHAQMRLLHKLNDEHVIPEKVKKMKVKNCTRVFSKTVAATLSYTSQFNQYADGTEVSSTLKNTAEIVTFFDDLFDSVNGTSYNKTSKGKPLRQAVTEKSSHHVFWQDAIKKLNDIRFIDKHSKEMSVPSLKNWVTTIKSYQRVWQYLKKKNIKIMRPRFLNSDPIENFFGQLRAYNFRNTDPDCHTFKNTFRSLLITRFIKFHSDSYNCEEDSGEQLLKLKSLFNKQPNNEIDTEQVSFSPEPSELPSLVERGSIQSTAQKERINIHSRAYTTGWVIRKILNKNKCKNCEQKLTTKELNFNRNSINNWIFFKEFKNGRERKLSYPSDHAVRCFGSIVQEANEYLEIQPHHKFILNKIKHIIKSKYSFTFLDCQLHKDEVVEYFITLTLKLTIFNWCNTINKIFKGTDVSRLGNKILPQMQLKAYNKFKTKIKNKKKR